MRQGRFLTGAVRTALPGVVFLNPDRQGGEYLWMRQGRFLTGSLRRGGPLPYGRGSETPGGGAFQ